MQKTKNCWQCGSVINKKRKQNNGRVRWEGNKEWERKKFCSRKCYFVYKFNNPNKFSREKLCQINEGKYKKICVLCGKEFIPTCRHNGRIIRVTGKSWKNTKYCSRQCRTTSQKIKIKEWCKNNVKKRLSDEKILENRKNSQKKWREKHGKDYFKKYRNEHRDILNTYFLNRRLTLRGIGGSHTKDEWEKVKKLYSFTCPSCFQREPEIILTKDHIIPIKLNGSNNIENIQPLCRSCNSRKHTKIIKYPMLKQ